MDVIFESKEIFPPVKLVRRADDRALQRPVRLLVNSNLHYLALLVLIRRELRVCKNWRVQKFFFVVKVLVVLKLEKSVVKLDISQRVFKILCLDRRLTFTSDPWFAATSVCIKMDAFASISEAPGSRSARSTQRLRKSWSLVKILALWFEFARNDEFAIFQLESREHVYVPFRTLGLEFRHAKV